MYGIIFLIILIPHLFMKYHMDDIAYSHFLDRFNYIEFLKYRYFNRSSRLIIETVAIFLLRLDIKVWGVLNSLIYTFLIYLINKLVNKENDLFIIVFIACIFLLYPYHDISQVGWADTSLIYIWTFVFGLVSIIPLYNFDKNKKTKKWHYILFIPFIMYSINQEQMCALVLGFNILFLIYHLLKDKSISKYNFFCIVISIISVIFIIISPGNNYRFISSTYSVYLGYSKLNIFEKLYLGIVPTINILLQNKIIIFIFFILLSIATYFYSRKKFSKIISTVNIILSIFMLFLLPVLVDTSKIFNKIYIAFNYLGIPNLNNPVNLIPLIFSILFVADILFMLAVTFKKNILPFFIFLGGFLSRIIIGFTPSIFFSGNRTEYFFYMLIIIDIIFVFYKLYKDYKFTKKCKAVIILMLFEVVINNYIYILTNIDKYLPVIFVR